MNMTHAQCRRDALQALGEAIALYDAERNTAFANLVKLPQAGSLTLLGDSTKIVKGEAIKVLTTVLYLAPANEARIVNTCPWATKACTAGCLGHTAGQMVFSTSKNSRIWKTILWKLCREEFYALLQFEIAAHERKARKANMIPAVRLDGTSDLGLAGLIAPSNAGVTFYDYTKSLSRAVEQGGKRGLSNWHITFSRSGENDPECAAVLKSGGNVAAVFATEDENDFPETFMGYPTLNADTTDARFLDEPGHVGCLTWKGPLANAAAPFAVSCEGHVPTAGFTL